MHTCASGSIVKRGILLSPGDLGWAGWIGCMRDAGLNYLGLHGSRDDILSFLHSQQGEAALAAADRVGISVNFELHVLSDLLPRDLFDANPEFFRMDRDGTRQPDANLCISSGTALSIVLENAGVLAGTLRQFSDIRRFYFWPDDGAAWCHCPSCEALSYPDQYLILVNGLCVAFRETQTHAQVPYLAYTTTLEAASQVQPAAGVFLQYAPIFRSYERALDDQTCDQNRPYASTLGALCAFFGIDDAEVLEYWLDVSRFSGWRRPAVQLPYSQEIVEQDLEFYSGLGIKRFSAFGVWIDEAYVAKFGVPPIDAYGEALRGL